jgi:hypothetical protein
MVGLAVDGDADAESALPEPAASGSYDGAPIDITSSFLTSSATPRPMYPLPKSPATTRLDTVPPAPPPPPRRS